MFFFGERPYRYPLGVLLGASSVAGRLSAFDANWNADKAALIEDEAAQS
jgi:hypothetical protein